LTADARPRSVETLFAEHADTVYRYCRVRLGPTDAQDAVSEVFIVAMRRLDEIPENAVAWLLGVSRRVVANQLRSGRRAAALEDRVAATADLFLPDHADSVAEADIARRALARLAPADRDVIVLLAANDMKPADLATALGCSPGAAAVRAHRARKRLKAAYDVEQAAAPRRRSDGAAPAERSRPARAGNPPVEPDPAAVAAGGSA
jgi:RNA polymerase sigma-70 factor (ECF subfamily)